MPRQTEQTGHVLSRPLIELAFQPSWQSTMEFPGVTRRAQRPNWGTQKARVHARASVPPQLHVL